jgi:hypothetical protein
MLPQVGFAALSGGVIGFCSNCRKAGEMARRKMAAG